jgi:DNA polymerase-3 subunit epsilon/CBS domain-containing protein
VCAIVSSCAADVRGLGWLLGRRHAEGRSITVDALLKGGFVAIDLETTGLDAGSAQLVEVAAIPFREGSPQPGYVTLVNPQCPIPAEATRIHSITDADVRDAPGLDDALSRLEPLLASSVLVGHAVEFDVAVLNRERRARGQAPLPNPVVDTQRLAGRLHPGWGTLDLDSLAVRVGIGILGRHTAEGDARAAGGLFLALLEEARRQGLRTLDDLLTYDVARLR